MTTVRIPNQTTRLSNRAVNRIESIIREIADPRRVPDPRKVAVQLHEAVTGRRA